MDNVLKNNTQSHIHLVLNLLIIIISQETPAPAVPSVPPDQPVPLANPDLSESEVHQVTVDPLDPLDKVERLELLDPLDHLDPVDNRENVDLQVCKRICLYVFYFLEI